MTQLSTRGWMARDRALRAGKGLKTYNPVLHGLDQFRGVPLPIYALARDSQGLLRAVRLRWVSPNTHNLGWTEDPNCRRDRQGRLGPVSVCFPFDVEPGHLASDSPCIRSEPSLGEEPVECLGDGPMGGHGQGVARAESPAHAAPGGVERVGETDPVGIDLPVVGCFVDESSDGVVHTQIAPGFLIDPRRGLRSQDHPGATLVGLQLVEDRLDLPSLAI